MSFWKKYGVHHPFLLPTYPLKKNTGGVPYHRRFSWMKLSSDYAPHVSFIELLDDLANQLKMAYQTLFTLAGHGPRSSRLQMFSAGIEEKQRAIGPMQNAARDVLENGGKLTDEEMMRRLLELEGHLAHLDRVREKFHVDPGLHARSGGCLPRLLRLRDAPRYLGIDRNKFNSPSIPAAAMGKSVRCAGNGKSRSPHWIHPYSSSRTGTSRTATTGSWC